MPGLVTSVVGSAPLTEHVISGEPVLRRLLQMRTHCTLTKLTLKAVTVLGTNAAVVSAVTLQGALYTGVVEVVEPASLLPPAVTTTNRPCESTMTFRNVPLAPVDGSTAVILTALWASAAHAKNEMVKAMSQLGNLRIPSM